MKKSKKLLKAGLIIGLIPFIIIQFLIYYGGRDESTEEIDYVIILGARVYGEKPSNSLSERINTAIMYLKENKNVKIIATGGKGKNENISEAEAIRRELLKNNIEENRIILEDKSKNTVENLKYSLLKIREDGFTSNNVKILIVTNRYHLYRSKKIAELLGFTAYGLPARTPFISIPKSYIREFLSVIKFYFEKENIKKM